MWNRNVGLKNFSKNFELNKTKFENNKFKKVHIVKTVDLNT